MVETLKIPHRPDNQLTDGVEVVGLTHSVFYFMETFFILVSGTYFCKTLSKPQGRM
jgi:hypothetical protein